MGTKIQKYFLSILKRTKFTHLDRDIKHACLPVCVCVLTFRNNTSFILVRMYGCNKRTLIINIITTKYVSELKFDIYKEYKENLNQDVTFLENFPTFE